MQCAHLAAGCVLALIGSAGLSAQAPSPQPVRPSALEAAVPLKAFSRLFGEHRPGRVTAPGFDLGQDFARPNSARRFICTTRVLPADPTVDRAFELPLPAPTPRFTMRIVAPACR